MNEPADTLEALVIAETMVDERGRVSISIGLLNQVIALIERLSSAPAKDECASPREAPAPKIIEALTWLDGRAKWAAAHPLPEIQNMQAGLLWIAKTIRAIRGEANSSPVADTEAMEAARRIKSERYIGTQFVRDARTVAHALLAQEGARQAVIETALAALDAVASSPPLTDDASYKGGFNYAVQRIGGAIRALGARKEQE